MAHNQFIRDEILAMVSSMLPFDETEKEHLNFTKNWISSGAEIFRIAKPDKPKIHLVSYFMVVDPTSNEFLLVDHKQAECWLPPGGHVELNEHPRETVKREVQEELGIEAEFLFEKPLFLTVTETVANVARHTDVSFWYLLRADRHTALNFDPKEFHQIRWFYPEDIPYERADRHIKRFIDKVIKKLVTLKSYDASAWEYAQNTTNLHPKNEALKFINTLPVNAKIIDIGCGPGRDAKIFSDYGFEVVGVDFSAKMIEAAKHNAPQCSFYTMDIENLAFPSESFDGAWANCTLLHVPKMNLPAVLDKIHGLLKPKGFFYLSVKQSHSGEGLEKDSRYDGLEKFWSYYETNELIHLLTQAQFRIVDVILASKDSDYHTHPRIKIFAEKS